MITYDPKRIISETLFFKYEYIKWVLNIIIKNLKNKSINEIETLLRNSGKQLTNEEKIELGLRKNVKIGHDFLKTLSDKGKIDPLKSSFIVVQRVLHKKSIYELHEKIRQDTKSYKQVMVEIMSAGDEIDCSYSKKLENKKFKFDEVPDLPLSDCNAEYCRCILLYHF